MSKFKFNEPQESIGLQFWKLHNKWQKRISKSLSRYDVNHTQFVILATIQWHEDRSVQPSQSDITKVTGIEKMTLSKAIVRLEELRLVKRVKSKVDTRTMNVSLTKKSNKLIPLLIEAVESIDEEIFDIKSTKNKALFTKLLIDLSEKPSVNK